MAKKQTLGQFFYTTYSQINQVGQKFVNLILILSLLVPSFITPSLSAQAAESNSIVKSPAPSRLTYQPPHFEHPTPRSGSRDERNAALRSAQTAKIDHQAAISQEGQSRLESTPMPSPMPTPTYGELKADRRESITEEDAGNRGLLAAPSPSDWHINGTAAHMADPAYIRLTADGQMGAGSAWKTEQIDLSQNFIKTFKVYLGSNDNYGADGIAFVLQNNGVSTVGNVGGQLGYGGVPHSIAVAIDTYYNYEYNDSAADHLSIHNNGSLSHGSSLPSVTLSNIEDGQLHELKIQWTAQSNTMLVYLDDEQKLTYQADLVNDIFQGDSSVWFGFTGATWSYKNLQYFSDISKISDDTTACNGSGDCHFSTHPQTQSQKGDPINTRTGGFEYNNTDISFQTDAGTVSLQRFYTSVKAGLNASHLGYGWTNSQDTRLIFEQSGDILFKAHSANQYHFYSLPDETYLPEPGLLASLTLATVIPELTYRLIDAENNIYTFDNQGKLITWVDATGHSLLYTYTPDGLLDQIATEDGARYLTVAYDSEGRISTIGDHAGRSVTCPPRIGPKDKW